MNGIEAIKAMMEGKTVKVIKAFGTLDVGVRYRFDNGRLVLVLSRAESSVKMNDFLASEFEVMPEYPLNFFEAMQAVDEGKTVQNDWVDDDCSYKKDEEGNLVYNNDFIAGLSVSEIKAKWKIVGE